MGIFDFLSKKKDSSSQRAENFEAGVKNAVETEAPEAKRELTPDEIQYSYFQTALTEQEPIKRCDAIKAITNQYWLSRLVREGAYENDRIQALEQLTDQNILFELAKEEGNIPRVRSLCQDKLDDAHRLQLVNLPLTLISEADKSRAVSRINDPEILKEIIGHFGIGRSVQLTAAGRLERIAPDEAKKIESTINYLRRKF